MVVDSGIVAGDEARTCRYCVEEGCGELAVHGHLRDSQADLAVGVLLAIFVTALAALSLPRKQVRWKLVSASRLVRIQYRLVLGPSVLLAALLWLDIWSHAEGHPIGPLFTVIIFAGCAWGLVLAASAALQSLSTRKARP